jgi:hypothetical protein
MKIYVSMWLKIINHKRHKRELNNLHKIYKTKVSVAMESITSEASQYKAKIYVSMCLKNQNQII